jgi:O-antigen ligase
MELPRSVPAVVEAPASGSHVPGSDPSVSELWRPSVASVPRISGAVRWAFYGFVFSLFFEYPNRVNLPIEIPTLTGCLFLVVALLHADVCFAWPPSPAWKWLAVYLGLWMIMAMYSEHPWGGRGLFPATLTCSLLLGQILLLFWVAYNLLGFEEVATTTLWVLVAGSVSLRLFALLHLVPSFWFYGRLYIMGQNPNFMAHHLSVGLVALLGLVTVRNGGGRWRLIVLTPCAAVLLYTIVQSGSRGGALATAAGLLALAFQGGSIGQQVKAVLVSVLAGGFLYWAVIQSPSMTQRYERTISGADLAGREDLFPNAWQMFLEKPLLGWGPIDNWDELGRRVPLRRPDHPEGEREPHNAFLDVLTATGLIGGIPVFIALGLCTSSAWRARGSAWGVLPLAMVAVVVVVNMGGSFLMVSKLDWIALAYAAASGDAVWQRRSWWAGVPRPEQTQERSEASIHSTPFEDLGAPQHRRIDAEGTKERLQQETEST